MFYAGDFILRNAQKELTGKILRFYVSKLRIRLSQLTMDNTNR